MTQGLECGLRDRMRPQSFTRRAAGRLTAAAVGVSAVWVWGATSRRRRRRRATAAAVGKRLVPGRRSGRHPAGRPGRGYDGGDRQHHEADDCLRGSGGPAAFRAAGGAAVRPASGRVAARSRDRGAHLRARPALWPALAERQRRRGGPGPRCRGLGAGVRGGDEPRRRPPRLAGHQLREPDRPRRAGQLLDPSGPGHVDDAAAAGAALSPHLRHARARRFRLELIRARSSTTTSWWRRSHGSTG